MNDEPDDPERPVAPQEPVEAHVRPRRWVVWVWVVPIAAAAVVAWLAYRAIAERGPEITISFAAAQGLLPGQATIQHLNASLGTVTSLHLTHDMRRVIVHARMSRVATPYLNDSTIFYVVTPHLGVEGISGLSTIVSGAYIEMYPGKGSKPRRHFVGLDNPPIIPPGTAGRSFTLYALDLSSLSRGSPVTYRGVDVGVVTNYALAADGHDVSVTTFIRAPNDRLVRPGTHFWNAGGVAMTLGAQGLQVRANSWQQLLAGGVAFDTAPAAMADAPAAAGSIFQLFDNEQAAKGTPAGPPLLTETLHNLNDVLKNLNRATTGPQLHDAVASLNRVLTHLDRLAVETRPNLNQLIKSLRATSDATQRTLALIRNRAGGNSPANTDLPQLMNELGQAARSVRELADYLDRHPDALLRGRRPESQ
ncbi:MAG TPA: MlaD family protein [Steroidobacteraceae bacterium]|jgi:paraquat-inducible protein B|nr:MlaD family protein [Steroidobacteraceae bacterium]